jgi:hypothetical protein
VRVRGVSILKTLLITALSVPVVTLPGRWR